MLYSAHLTYDLIYKLDFNTLYSQVFNSLYSQVNVLFYPYISSICLKIWVKEQSERRVVNYSQNNLSFHKLKHCSKQIFVCLKLPLGYIFSRTFPKVFFFSRSVPSIILSYMFKYVVCLRQILHRFPSLELYSSRIIIWILICNACRVGNWDR